jgi:hypothetical protein
MLLAACAATGAGAVAESRRLRNMFGRVRPERPDIAAPDLPPGIEWIGGKPPSMLALTATGPALVHFFDFAQLNSVRALPYPVEWARRYADAGLAVIGVQAPRFEFGADPEVVRSGLERLGVSHPVAIDAGHEIWNDYGCQGWPSLFLWGRGGVLRWFHFGEGEYLPTEEAIQQELRASDALRELPAPMDPLRATDAPGARVLPPTPERFPGGEGAALRLGPEDDPLELDYEGAGAYATLQGNGTVEVAIDAGAPVPVRVENAGLYELGTHPRHERHRLSIAAAEGEVLLWSLSFAPGMP